MSHSRSLLASLSLSLLLLLPACGWTRLGYQAWRHPETARGEAANVVVDGGRAYAALGEDGIAVVDPATGATLRAIAPPAGTDRVDDLACADRLLFVLDATPPGHLSVLDLSPADAPRLLDTPRAVPVGPFSGVAAAAGRVIVSGGTSDLTVFTYDRTGLRPMADGLDLGRGQPDVSLAPDGATALVSTHFRVPRFGVTLLAIDGEGRVPPFVRDGERIPVGRLTFRKV